jgi:hypothetical protein
MRIADGAGGLRELKAQGLDDGTWPVQRIIPAQDAAEWMAHWSAIAASRGWSAAGVEQLHAQHNAGSLTVHLGAGAEAPAIECSWEKLRDGDLQIRVRPAPTHPPAAGVFDNFLAQIDDHLQRRVRDREYRRGWLNYEGLPWTGELWLSDQLRLGRPSRFPPALTGPQVVVIDAMVEGIGQRGVIDAFTELLRDLTLVLSPLVGVAFRDRMQFQTEWVPETDEQFQYTDCRPRPVGYIELDHQAEFPGRGTTDPLPLIDVTRPGLEPLGVRLGQDQCVKVARDIPELWGRFRALPTNDRDQFRRACNVYGIAESMWPDQRTAYAAFLVVACETLKPRGRRARGANIYDVVATLLGRDVADTLKANRHPPQEVRSQHVHRGELVGSELAVRLSGDDFRDPSFDEMLWQLSSVTRRCLIEWLRRGGIQRLTWMPRPSKYPWVDAMQAFSKRIWSLWPTGAASLKTVGGTRK